MHIFRSMSNPFSLPLMPLFILPPSAAVYTWHLITFSYCSHVLRASVEEWQSISGDPIKYVQNSAPLQSQAATEISFLIITRSPLVANISPTDLVFLYISILSEGNIYIWLCGVTVWKYILQFIKLGFCLFTFLICFCFTVMTTARKRYESDIGVANAMKILVYWYNRFL